MVSETGKRSLTGSLPRRASPGPLGRGLGANAEKHGEVLKIKDLHGMMPD